MTLKDSHNRAIEAHLTTEHAASSYGIPVLVVDGEALGTLDAKIRGLRIVEASAEERRELARAGYELELQE